MTVAKDPTVEEIRETRERLLDESGGTLAGLVDRLRKEERESGRVILRPKPRPTTSVPREAAPAAVAGPTES
jgi:hypothetical protein